MFWNICTRRRNRRDAHWNYEVHSTLKHVVFWIWQGPWDWRIYIAALLPPMCDYMNVYWRSSTVYLSQYKISSESPREWIVSDICAGRDIMQGNESCKTSVRRIPFTKKIASSSNTHQTYDCRTLINSLEAPTSVTKSHFQGKHGSDVCDICNDWIAWWTNCSAFHVRSRSLNPVNNAPRCCLRPSKKGETTTSSS